MGNDTKPSYYIGIGASAGGLEAIEAFFKNVSVHSGMAFIVIQHLSPDHKSLMPELLSKRTSMPVFRAEDGLEVQANSIYLLVPRKSLRIFHGKLLLSDMHRTNGLNLPIDIFLKSLAEDQHEKAIAIILSGTGSDGTRGCRAIKEFGGMIMVQDEESAKFDAMPKSVIATGLPDFILAPEKMPKQLEAFIKHPLASKAESLISDVHTDTGITRIFSILRDQSKMDFTYYRPNTILRRIERRMSINQIHDMNDYIHYMDYHPNEVDLLHKELLIGVTNFFRDINAFDELEKYLQEVFLKERIKKELRVWVAGCSTGEEAYSFAILLNELMLKHNKKLDIKIFATDVDQSSIEFASTGIYPVGIASDIAPELLNKYFISKDDSFQVIRTIREMIVFAQHNLIKDPPFTNIDFISCRNLLIYLQPVLQEKVLEFFNFSLVPNGILFLGMSETTGEMGDFFENIHHKYKIYRSKGKRKAANIANGNPINSNANFQNRFNGTRISNKNYEDNKLLDRFLQAFSDDFILFSVLVNSSGELIHSVGDTSTYLKILPGEMHSHISKLICKELSIPLSTGLQKVLSNNKELTFSKIRISNNDSSKVVQLKIKPLEGKKNQDNLVAIFVSEMKNSQIDQDSFQTQTFDMTKEAEQRIIDLEQELQFTRENLQATVEELETSNEELQSTNEELLSSNEELQSTNEELQSVNEELYTVNAELQSKLTELTELNNDLDNLLNSTEIATLFLDENLNIRRFSPLLMTIFNIIENDIGRNIFHLSHKIKGINLEERINQVITNNRAKEYKVNIDKKYYLMRLLPYKISSAYYSGVVILFIDITTLQKTKKALKRSEQHYNLVLQAGNIGAWEWEIETGKIKWSDVIYSIYGINKNDFDGTIESYLKLIHPDDVPIVEKAIHNTLNFNEEYVVEHRIILPDNSINWIVTVGELAYSKDGKPKKLFGIVRNITEKHLN